jgi:hypothetical protein
MLRQKTAARSGHLARGLGGRGRDGLAVVINGQSVGTIRTAGTYALRYNTHKASGANTPSPSTPRCSSGAKTKCS